MSAANLRLLLPFVFSAILILLLINTLRGQADQLTSALRSANWPLLAPAIGLYFVGVWLRSIRWGLLLPEHAVKVSILFRALVVGFTVNNLLPLRMGEVARAYLLARWGRVSYSSTVASLLVERVLDGLSLALLLLAALLFQPSAPAYLWAVGAIAGCGFLAGAAVLAIAAWRASALTALAAFVARFLPLRMRARVSDAAASFARSLALVHDPVRLLRLLALSLVAWCFELGLFFVLMFSLGIAGSYPQALLVGSAANFATLLPSSPGYAGTFDAALTKVAQDVLGISAGLAGAYDLIVHATLFLPVVVVGTLVLWRSNVSFGQLTHTPKPAIDTLRA
ncbi:MAG: flippase-like domain-containing protein [Chloroflexi bacterium]|nr:flippase-like domain-containing protein [Chloroflexota bacterium]MBV9895828.1 flippase-like domain-containing protein [Chloroflexota bacterium]